VQDEDRQQSYLVGYARVFTFEQIMDLRQDALRKAGCSRAFTDTISGATKDRVGLLQTLSFLCAGDTLVVWRLDRLGRSLKHLIETVTILHDRGIGFISLTEHIDTTTSTGKLIFHIFAAVAEFERELIVERTKAGLAAARARERHGGAPYKMTAAKLRPAMAAVGQPETHIGALCRELGVTRQTLYRHVGPDGALRADGKRLLAEKRL